MITVLSAGFFNTIQDLGRPNFASIGVPVSGAIDVISSTNANVIIGNPENCAVLEITFGGCQLLFEVDTFICISGADFSAKINSIQIKMNQQIQIFKDDILSFGKSNFGAKTYLAVSGGFLTEVVLGSRSYLKGITENWKIYKGQKLEIESVLEKPNNTNASIKTQKQFFEDEKLTCFQGPEFDLLNQQQRNQLLHSTFTISSNNNRMGYQLQEKLENNFQSMLTSAVLPGTVQLTPNGTLIILKKDCQVTGGYPRILQLSDFAICKLTQKSTHQKLKFELY